MGRRTAFDRIHAARAAKIQAHVQRRVGECFRLQRCIECGYEGAALAVLHLQDCFPCPVCKHATRREYADGKPKPETKELL